MKNSPKPGLSRRRLKQAATMATSVMVAGSLLTGCAASQVSTTTTSTEVGGPITDEPISTLDLSLTAAADSLDIAKSFTSQTGQLSSLGYDTLVVLDHNMQISPWIATMTETSPTQYTFDLHPGVKFWDGTPLTADDVVWSYTRHLDPELHSRASSILSTVKEVKPTSDTQVVVELTAPDPTFKYSASIIQIFKKQQGLEAGAAFGSPTAIPLGTGQYVLTDYTTGGGLTGTLNRNYWGKAPTVQQIKVKVVENTETIRIAAQQGATAGVFDVPNAQLTQWNGTPSVRTGTAPGLSPLMLRFPMSLEPFDDLNVRKALAFCIDRDGIVKSLLGGAGEVATSLATRGHWQGVMSNAEVDAFLKDLPSYSLDLDKAAAALAASKVPDGFTADIFVVTGNDVAIKTASSIASNAKKIGITLNVKVISRNELQQDYLIAPGKKHGLVVSTTAPTYPDPTDMFIPFLDTDPNVGYLNASGFSDAKVNTLLKEQVAATGTDRVNMLKQIAQIAQEQLPVAPIAWVDATVGLRTEYNLNNFDAFTYYRPWVQDLGIAKK